MAIQKLERIFKYKDKELKDINIILPPNEILEAYTSQFPELLNSKVSGPKIENNKAYYEFKTTIGTKG